MSLTHLHSAAFETANVTSQNEGLAGCEFQKWQGLNFPPYSAVACPDRRRKPCYPAGTEDKATEAWSYHLMTVLWMHASPPPSLLYDTDTQTIIVISVSLHLQLTRGDRIFLKKPTVAHLVKKSCALYVTGKFNTPSLAPIVSHEFSQGTLTLFFEIHYNIILPSTARSSKWPVLFRFS
jgi:hypothetical protein